MAREIRVDLVRHADAGDRGVWFDDDSKRPLTEKGLKQAAALADSLAVASGAAVYSSPAQRCVQTVEPIAHSLELPVAIEERCGEGRSPDGIFELVAELDGDAVVCSHGDVIGGVVFTLIERGLISPDARIPKASTWRLRVSDGQVTDAAYVAPPKPGPVVGS